MKINNKLNLAYMAGLFDGEGCIMICRRADKKMKSPRYYLRCSLSMANPYMARLFQFNFEGSVSSRKIRPDWQRVTSWAISDKLALAFLRTVLPYLRLKRNEAELGIDFQENRMSNRKYGCRGLPEAELVLREADRILMKSLKIKG